MRVTLRGNKYLVYDEKTSDHVCFYRSCCQSRIDLRTCHFNSGSSDVSRVIRGKKGANISDLWRTTERRQKKVWRSVGNWACQTHTAQSTSFPFDLLKRIKADGRVTCPCVWRAPGGSFLSLHKGVKRASSLTCRLTHPSKRHQRRHLKNMTDETIEDDSVVSLESSGGSELSVKLLSVCRSC